MSLRLNRAWLMLVLLLAGNAFALGLGEIRLSSALNEPLRAEIELLSATPEELDNLKVQLASPDTFKRYGLDRPLYLTRLQFSLQRSGRSDGNVVRVRSQEPLTEPFVTFLIEASWQSGRLLREYTVLLDPPTFAPPPAAQSSQAVTAPSRAAPADSGRIERPAPRESQAPAAAADRGSFDSGAGGDVRVQRGDTLWGIAQRVRPDERLSMNQTMLAIYQANPQAFAGNINRLTAGSNLSVPSADDIFRISRSDAVSEVQRQNSAYGIEGPSARTQPSLTLVPPDRDQQEPGGVSGQQPGTAGEQALRDKIEELEETVADQNSLIEIRDNELARLREELARMRQQPAGGQTAPAEQTTPAEQQATPPIEAPEEQPDEVFADDSDVEGTGEATKEPTPPPAEAERPAQPKPAVVRSAPPKPGLVDRIIGFLTSIWGIIGLALVVAIVVLLWFAKRAAGRDDESTGVWEALDAGDDDDDESRASTERLRALARDDDSAIVVVEQESAPERRRKGADTMEMERAEEFDEGTADTGAMPALEDTFSSDTAINLDQSDPIAEADFHMAYGLYDQAADLINGALAVEPERQDLMAKLCEIYFVWGNRDAFVDAASRLHDQLGGESSPDWDKIVIMGQQIAADHRLFSGVSAAAATRSVDLSFDDAGESGVLDMDFDAGGPDGAVSDVIDLGGEEEETGSDMSGLDFVFDEAEGEGEEEQGTGATTTREMANRGQDDDVTVENPTIESRASDKTVESPTIEEQFDRLDSTSELPAFSEDENDAVPTTEATAEIDLDDLGLDLEGLAQSGLDVDLDDTGDEGGFGTGETEFDIGDIDETTESPALGGDDDETGKNRSLDDLESTSEMPLVDESTGKNPAATDPAATDVEFDSSLLDATGQTQILSGDFGVGSPGDDDATMLAPLNDEDDIETGAFSSGEVDFEFAETEALPKETWDRSSSNDETGEMPGGDVDLDLDDLTAALRVTEGDTVDQPREEATIEQPRAGSEDVFGDIDDDTPTEALSPDDLSDDLHDARTMTEVGTKLDLARAYVDMGDPDGARSILEEVLDEGDEGQKQQAQKLIESLPS